MRIITSEQVSAGHPDKICDQIADAIVTDCLQHDRNSRVAIECLFKNRCLVIAGELTSTHEPDYKALVQQVFDRINNGGAENRDAGLDYKLDFTVDDLDIAILVDHQSNDIAIGVNTGGAGDQGMMYGYATNETPEMLPIPFVLATRFLELLKAYPCRMLKADAKAQVSFDYDSGKITTFLCSVQHIRDVEVEDFRPIIERLMVRTATEYGLNTDFAKLVNPTGRFVLGSSFADCGVTGRKLACDTYGGIGHIGGGAMSGKDPSKVDRSGAYAARKIARDIVSAGYADKAEVQIAYAIGVAEPVSVYVETFGTEHQDAEFINQYVRENYDLTPRGIIESLGLLDVDYNKVSAYGHFGKSGLPWCPLPRQYMRGVVQTDQHTICGADRSLPNINTGRRQRTCQADRTHRAGIPAVLHSFPTVRSTVKSTVPSTRRTQGQQAAEATARHGTEPASVTLRHIRCVWSA